MRDTFDAMGTVMVSRNYTAAFVWGFTCFFIMGVAMMTCMLLRDGLPQGAPPLLSVAMAGMFWLGALVFAGFASTRCCTTVILGSDETVTFVQRYPFRVSTRIVAIPELPVASVVEREDTEGSPYFYARAVLPDGIQFDLAEGHDRLRCERAVERFDSIRNGQPPLPMAR